MAEVLNRLGFRLRQVVKATPQKKMAETDAMCANSEKPPQAATASPTIKRLRIDGQATVAIGEVSRGGLTRGDHRACEHDLGVPEQYSPGGIVAADRAPLRLPVGSSGKTSDCLVDALEAWWAALDEAEQVAMARLQSTMENGPESSGRRTPCLQRRVALCDGIGKPIPLLYSPPYQRK